ncbi:MAG: amino acid permease, partial [Acidimicrobiales bacterium]
GVSILARLTHAVPYILGVPTVLSQEARYVFGYSALGTAGYFYVQAVTMLILYTGANTSFNGFPNLASFVAEDAYLPRQLTRRGHRLVFSNGIIILAVLSMALILGTRGSLNSLVALYAIGVFVGFTMAGSGMVKHHLTHKEKGWTYRIGINGFAAILSLLIVGILAVVKFTEGAWLVVVLFPILFVVLIRLHKQYTEEKSELEANVPHAAEAPVLRRHVVLVFVERLDLATARALQYARTLQPDELRAVHFVLDTAVSTELEEQWLRLGLSRFSLDLIECPDRRITRAAMDVVAEAAADGNTEVSVLLPRRVFEGIWRRVLHDRTADRIAGYVSQLPNANATIVPFPLGKRRRELVPWKGASSEEPSEALASLGEGGEGGEGGEPVGAPPGRIGRRPLHPWSPAASPPSGHSGGERESGRAGTHGSDVVPVSELRWRQRAKVRGRVRSIRVQPKAGVPSVECTLVDQTGQILLVFQGRRRYPGIDPGAVITAEGMVGERGRQVAMINPIVDIVKPADGGAAPGGGGPADQQE